MVCALPGIGSGTGIDPTLPRDGTDFITLKVVMRIHVWLRLCCAVFQRRANSLGRRFTLSRRATLNRVRCSACRMASDYKSFLNCSTVKPASRAIPPIVNALTGLCRGIVRIRIPSDITICFPWRRIRKPAFSNALTASRWLTPGILGTIYTATLTSRTSCPLTNSSTTARYSAIAS
jgi:hypothetical protein